MRKIPLTDQTKEVLRIVLENAPGGMNLDEMRTRVSLQEKLNSANGEFLIEEPEFKLVSKSASSFPWAKATKDLLDALDTIVKAETADA